MTQWLSSGGEPPFSLSEKDAGGLPSLPELGVVFCDWLDLTFSPTEDIDSWLRPFLASMGSLEKEPTVYSFPSGGVIKHQKGLRWQRLSISGASLGVIRLYSLFDELLSLVSRHPYKVTRLDAALDVGVDAAPIVSRLWAVYQSGGLRLNVWNELTCKAILSSRFDGVITGTFYGGNRRRNKVTARVYDKQHEYFERHSLDIGSRIRYELTVKTDQVNLRDVADPAPVFWHYMNPGVIRPDSDVSPWVPGNPYQWAGVPRSVLSAEDRLHRAVAHLDGLESAMAICGDSVAMFELLLKLLRLRVLGRASRLPGWKPSYL